MKVQLLQQIHFLAQGIPSAWSDGAVGFLCPGSSLCPTSVLQHFVRSSPPAPSALSPCRFGQKIEGFGQKTLSFYF